MIDINLIREKPEFVKENIKRKDQNEKLVFVDKIRELDKEWRELKGRLDDLRHFKNKLSEEINFARKSGNNELFQKKIKEAKELPEKISSLELKTELLEKEIKELMFKIPNIISKQTPKGKDEFENVEIKKVGKIPKFNFEPKNHVELLENLGLVDFEASSKVAGNGFYYLKNELAILNQALIQFTLDLMIKKGYSYIEPPLMLHKKEIYASMDKKAIEQSVYSIKDEDLNLIGTSEQSILAMHSNKLFKEIDLPKKYFSYSMCFRKEVGAHGINEKGLWRTHQFNKVEQFIFCKPEDSEKYYEELFKNSEEILKTLELPFRILEICTGDLADWKYRSADFEVYRPTTKEYGEVMSLSNCTDYQARKLDIKSINNVGDKKIVHTLNDTAMATSRILVVLIENNQDKDGSIKIPKALWKYTGFKIIKSKKKIVSSAKRIDASNKKIKEKGRENKILKNKIRDKIKNKIKKSKK